ncbi:MAG: hypothetical protein COW42_15010 [Deltaproteobacteria bacterium CG17_big_fil_post_rev_8_21_14_2_50_63_7]|nr:MAG: hypothetical protein COW42_15010 [Deltaproteobacteria bacterium CG17_big_fil_post_rev_8_21_14_2_50_63_7]
MQARCRAFSWFFSLAVATLPAPPVHEPTMPRPELVLCFSCRTPSSEANPHATCPRCGAAIGLVARYLARRILGAGGSSRVFEVEDVRTGKRHALKLLNIQQLDDWKALEQFNRQFDILRGLEHPGVPKVFDRIDTDLRGVPCVALVQELVEGTNLPNAVADGLRFDEESARTLLESMLDILEYLHHFSPPIIHRDIKPSNIILRPDGKPVLIDFDTARGTGIDRSVADGTMVGTAGFVPMEQLGGRAEPASDLFGLGMTLITVLSQRDVTDFPVERMRLQFEPMVNVSDAFKYVLRKLIEPIVEDRFRNVAEVRRALATPPDELAVPPAELAAARTRFVCVVGARADALQRRRVAAQRVQQESSLEAERNHKRSEAHDKQARGEREASVRRLAREQLAKEATERAEKVAKAAERTRARRIAAEAERERAAATAKPAKSKSAIPSARWTIVLGLIVGASVVAGAVFNGLSIGTDEEVPAQSTAPAAPRGQNSPNADRVATQTDSRVTLDARDHTIAGDPDAPVMLAVFTDFQCPFCQRLDDSIWQLRMEFGSPIAVALYHNPLGFHAQAMPAAQAVWAAGQQGKAMEVAIRLFANQSSLGNALYLATAADTGLDLNQWRTDMASDAARTAIAGDLAIGASLEVKGVPVVFINGERFVGAQPIDTLREAVRRALNGQ